MARTLFIVRSIGRNKVTKHIGIVACSAEGAALCYRTICAEGPTRMGDYMHPEISMHTHPLGEYMMHILSGNWREVSKLMLSSARKLASAGAEFIICYFDESVQPTKYGLIGQESHCTEHLILYQLVLDDTSVALIVKPQFEWNSPKYFEQLRKMRAAAAETGRYLEMIYGAFRNIIFPAEAALTADISIGHAIGGTAPLEAALAGVRSIILNSYGVRSELDELYAEGDIVYPSLEAALDAIKAFRAGSVDRQRLGDWTPILHHFDPYRDGKAADRLRSILENAIQQAGTA